MKTKEIMCFDATTSLTSFLIGVMISITVGLWAWYQKDTALSILSLGWIWVVCMQWWEYMIWTGWNIPFASKMAYIFNIMQIPVLYFLFIIPSTASPLCKYIATTIVFLYVCFFMMPDGHSDYVQSKNQHLVYPWWSNRWRSTMYFIGLASVFLLLVRPLLWSLSCVTTLFILLLVSQWIYQSENVPSLWCFFAVSFPLLGMGYKYLLRS